VRLRCKVCGTTCPLEHYLHAWDDALETALGEVRCDRF
jgi:hypothetical protein